MLRGVALLKVSDLWLSTGVTQEAYHTKITGYAYTSALTGQIYNKSNYNLPFDSSIAFFHGDTPLWAVPYKVGGDSVGIWLQEYGKGDTIVFNSTQTPHNGIIYGDYPSSTKGMHMLHCRNSNVISTVPNKAGKYLYIRPSGGLDNDKIQPFTDFSYNSLIALPYVTASKSETLTNLKTWEWQEYWTNQYIEYQYITKIECTIYENWNIANNIYVSSFHKWIDNLSYFTSAPITPIIGGNGNYGKSLTCIYGGTISYIPSPGENFLESNNYPTLCNFNILTLKRVDEVLYAYTTPDKKNEIEKALNSYGIIWAESASIISKKNLLDDGVHYPEIKDGKTTGSGTNGVDNEKNDGYNWKNSREHSYDGDPNDYTDSIDLVTPTLTTTGIFNRTFAMNSENIHNLSDYLWNSDESIFNEIIKGLSLMGGNPIDGLIDLRLYPFDVSSKVKTGISQEIVVGRTNTHVQAIKINNYNAILNLGGCIFFRKFGNFLDYEPFTTASLYVPYVGIVPISTADFMGQTISCKMVVDITTGSCTAIVFANDIPIIYKNGNIGVEIPMTGTNSAEYASRIAGGLTSGATDIALGAASKSVGQVVSGVGSIVDSALSVNNTMYNTAGSSSPACGLWQPQNCYFIIQRPVPIVPENYGHTVGYACNYQAKISDCSGYTQTYNVDVSSINAPESEKNAIAQILNSGFYA